MSDAPPGGDASAEDLADLYENAPCGYLSIGPDGRITRTNATLSSWLGLPRTTLAGKRLPELLTVAGRVLFETHFAPLLRMQGFFNEVALDMVRADGTRMPALVNAVERRDAHGAPLATRLTVFNATERRRYERELLAARTAAEDARARLETLHASAQANLLDEQATSALREQFIAVLGHDLRNPLAAIDSGMQLLLKTPLDGRATTVVGMVRSSVARMAGLIDDVMDFARGRLGGGLVLDRADGPLEPVLHQVVAELQASHADRQIETRFAMTAPVSCDRRRIGQLASNLLGNALTHGAPGNPVVLDAATNAGAFELSVANAGNPIPPAVLDSIFQPFTRGTLQPGLQGLGLGLYICHAIATAHGGTLQVSSTPAETRFTLRMPTTPHPSTPSPVS